MKSKINNVLDFLMSWTKRAEIKKYKSTMLENNELISQAEFIIKKQEEIIDKGRLIKSDNITYFTLQKNVDYENAVNVKGNVEILKANLNAVNKIYEVLINANSGRSQAKQDIITDSNKKISDVENDMMKVTEGLSPKEYFYKFLPKELK